MERCELTINCPSYDQFLSALLNRCQHEEAKVLHPIHSTSHVLYYETYSFRNNSNLMVSVIIQKVDQYIKLTIYSGGGKTGLIQVGMGIEKSRIRSFLDQLIAISKENNWEFIQMDNEFKKYLNRKLK